MSITFVVKAAGTVQDFDEAAFKTNLAAMLDGVSSSDIGVTLTAASVIVTSEILLANVPVAASAERILRGYSAGDELAHLSTALGVAVTEADVYTSYVAVTPNPPPSSPVPIAKAEDEASGADVQRAWVIFSIFATCALVVSFTVGNLIVYGCKRKLSLKVDKDRFVSRLSQTGGALSRPSKNARKQTSTPGPPPTSTVPSSFGALVNDGAQSSYFRVPLPEPPGAAAADPPPSRSPRTVKITEPGAAMPAVSEADEEVPQLQSRPSYAADL